MHNLKWLKENSFLKLIFVTFFVAEEECLQTFLSYWDIKASTKTQIEQKKIKTNGKSKTKTDRNIENDKSVNRVEFEEGIDKLKR